MTVRTLHCCCWRKAGIPACPLRSAKKDVNNDYSWKYTEDIFQTPVSEGVHLPGCAIKHCLFLITPHHQGKIFIASRLEEG